MPADERPDARTVFGLDAAAYAAGRPGYPAAVFDLLSERCGLGRGTATFEIGPGTGQATTELLRRGASPLVAVEPDPSLADWLIAQRRADMADLTVVRDAFEDAELPHGAFDIGVAATSFHWLDQPTALRKVGSLLRPGGWWAMWANIHGDALGDDPFHNATRHLLDGPDAPEPDLPFALETDRRLADLRETGAFDRLDYELLRWTHSLDAAGIAALYRTFSPMIRRPAAERDELIRNLVRVVEDEFGGVVHRSMLTPIYVARRTG